jgi:hypothetical protein
MFNKYGVSACKGVECGFADEAGGCLIQQALQYFVTKEYTAAAQENTYYKINKNGTFDPIVFDQHKNKTIEVDCFWE